jgi:hypothetical protein
MIPLSIIILIVLIVLICNLFFDLLERFIHFWLIIIPPSIKFLQFFSKTYQLWYIRWSFSKYSFRYTWDSFISITDTCSNMSFYIFKLDKLSTKFAFYYYDFLLGNNFWWRFLYSLLSNHSWVNRASPIVPIFLVLLQINWVIYYLR